MAEVNDLLDRGMVDDYNCKSEHSISGKETATEADISPPQKAEVLAPPLDTSSQASVEEVETSLESNPINIYPTMATCSSHSDSPMVDLMELQVDANLAANYMLSIKRSSDLKRQWAIWDFEALLHQQVAKEAMANERAKIIHSTKNLKAKVGCAKAVMEAKYNYMMTIQEARMIRCNQLQELETTYSEALVKNAAVRFTQSLQNSAGNMWNICTNWRNKLYRKKIKVAKTFFLPVKPSYAMLRSLSRRICLPLTTFY